VFAVGDPDQAIYRWRGADSAKMSHSFLEDFTGAQSLVYSAVKVDRHPTDAAPLVHAPGRGLQ